MATKYFRDFSGSTNQNVAPDLIANNESPLMVNITQDETGNVAHRLGSDLIKKLGTGTSTSQGLGVYRKTSGQEEIYGVWDGLLYKYDEVDNIFIDIGTGTPIDYIDASDTDSTGSSATGTYDYFGQTFTANVTGTLTDITYWSRAAGEGVNCHIAGGGCTTTYGNVDVYVYSDNAGQPGTLLYSSVVQTPNFYAYQIGTSPGISVTNGNKYWFIQKSSVPVDGTNGLEVTWKRHSTNVYSGGDAYEISNSTSTTPPTSGWSTIGTTDFAFKATITATPITFNTSSTVDFINYDDKLYMIGSADEDELIYTDGGVMESVSGNITGKYLAAGGGRLLVGGDGRNVYYSDVGTDTFNLTTNKLTLDLGVTGIASLGDLNPFVAFDRDNTYIFDPNTDTSRKASSGVGCISHYSIAVSNGEAIWLGTDAIYSIYANSPFPTNISAMITNNVSYDAIFNQISGAIKENTFGHIYKNKYYLSVDNLLSTVKGYTLNNCFIVYDLVKNSYSINTYTDNSIGKGIASWKDSNDVIYMISSSRGEEGIYKVEVDGLYTDDDIDGGTNDVTALYRTKFFNDFRYYPETLKTIEKGFIKITAVAGLSIKYAKDGATTYTDWATTEATESGYDWHWNELAPFADSNVREISLQFSGTGKWTLHHIGFEYSKVAGTGLQII